MIALKASVVGVVVSNVSFAEKTKPRFLLACHLASRQAARAAVVSNVSFVGRMPRPLSPAVLTS